LLETTIAGLRAYASEHKAEIVLRAPETAPGMGDPDRLIQVFTNLLSNAIKFSPRHCEVVVSLAVDSERARVSVRDRGPGIPTEFQARIFGKFQQAESSPSRRHGGTGLGLAIARAIVERHEGGIRFETAAGEGTTFFVELPCAPAPRVSSPEAPSGAPRVLVVDGDPDIVSILQTLASSVARLVGAATPDEALRLAREMSIDALIVEPELTGRSGIALVRELRSLRDYGDLPVIVFSSREYTAAELEGVTLSPAHAYVKARDGADDVVRRLKAMLAARVRQG
jgi:CheY-like chemotaxis protein